MSAVIDVHSHMFTRNWLELLRRHGGPDYVVAPSLDSPDTVHYRGASFNVLEPQHFDFEARMEKMAAAGVDMAIISLPAPSVFWASGDISLEAAQSVNDDFAAAQAKYPGQIRWMASLPWDYPELAVPELARACEQGAVAVLTLGNINGRHLTDELFAPIWQAIDDRALPVLVHPTVPPGTQDLALSQYAMVASIGFMVDTSVAVVRMIGEGFFDQYPNLKLIAAHAGATLPYLVGRLDRVYDVTRRARVNISKPPSEYLRQIYYDSVCYDFEALQMCLRVGGSDKLMYGSDYPFNLGDMEGCLARVDRLPEQQRHQVRSDNAIRIFNLGSWAVLGDTID
ncbi:MAG: amidohydrolase family protein [Pseudohongiellaceae bacterium]|jgi:aminocarboxymuconate-semialdehyde decarboxylase